jgi:phenylacetic acid degradation operon negative regulatory protein
MKPQTEEFLYFLLWSCDRLCRPTWRNVTDSFEGWAYRNGFQRQLTNLEKQKLLQRQGAAPTERIVRLTAAGRLRALGGRDPEVEWSRPWDGQWRLLLYDVAGRQEQKRKRLRRYLQQRHFGYLQKSVWITPDSLSEERVVLGDGRVDVESLVLLTARPCAGETDADIVAGAWDFDRINAGYTSYLDVLRQKPADELTTPRAIKAFHRWATQEKLAWREAVERDPLLPERLLPAGYRGTEAWRCRMKVLPQAAAQLKSFAP